VRVKHLILLLLAGALALGIIFVLKARSSDAPDSGADQAQGDDNMDRLRRLASRRRPGSVPQFQTVEPQAAPPPPAFTPPPPALVPPPLAEVPPDPKAELRQKASKDGYLFREAGSSVTYVVQGGSKYVVKTPEELRALGYKPGQVEEVAPGALDFLSSRPAERTLLKERDKPNVFYYENGQKRWITTPETFYKLGHKFTDIKVVPAGSLSGEATAAPIE
jgi:hypothetical protein